MARSRVAHVLADRFSQNRTSSFEKPSSDSRVAIRSVVLDEIGAQQHWYALQCDVVLQGKSFAFKLAAGFLLIDNMAFPRPSAMRIMRSFWEMYVLARISGRVNRWDVILGGVSTSLWPTRGSLMALRITHLPYPSAIHKHHGRRQEDVGSLLYAPAQWRHLAVSTAFPQYLQSRDYQLWH